MESESVREMRARRFKRETGEQKKKGREGLCECTS